MLPWNRSSLFLWIRERRYHLFAPLLVLGIVAMLHGTRASQMIEDGTINLRFRLRAPFDPPADPRLIFVGIDQQTVEQIGAWPWPRTVEADFLKTVVRSGALPHTIAMDLMFTDDHDKPWHHDTDDAEFGDAAGLLPSVITGALSIKEPTDPAARGYAEEQTRLELDEPSETSALPSIRGDIDQVAGSSTATFPIRPLRKQSLFGFVNDQPSDIDDVRHVIPLILRVRDRLYPSLALQTLCQMLNIDPENVRVDLPGGKVTLANSSGKKWIIPIDPLRPLHDQLSAAGFVPIDFLFLALQESPEQRPCGPIAAGLPDRQQDPLHRRRDHGAGRDGPDPA